MDGTRKRKLALMLLLVDDDDDDDVGKPCDVCKLALSVQTRAQVEGAAICPREMKVPRLP